jgi:two-component sensor histidine kinase
LLSSYGIGSDRIALAVHSASVLPPIDAAIPCGLVNELISNALKHAFPEDKAGKIWIDIAYADDGHVMLAVSDSGIGIPEGFDLTQTATLGLQLASLLVDQIGGHLRFKRRARPASP